MAKSTFEDDDWTDITRDDVVAATHPKTEQTSMASKQITSKPNDSGASLTIRQINKSFPKETVLYDAMQRTARKTLDRFPKAPIFHVRLGADITDAFLKELPTPEKQQEYKCQACKKFMRGIGQLALVDPKKGNLIPLFWDTDAQHDCFKRPVRAVANMFQGKKAGKQFKLTERVIKRFGGEERGTKYTHMSFRFPKTTIMSAEPKGVSVPGTAELSSMLERILEDYDADTIDQAASLLDEDKLPYADKHRGALRWLQHLVESNRLTKNQSEISRHNLICLEASSAYLGCLNTLRSGAAGTLLSSVKKGLSFEEIKRAWKEVCNPFAYMRPSAAPKAGNIKAAERLFADLGLTESDLRRAYLAPDGLPNGAFLYRQPVEIKSSAGGTSSGIFESVIPRTTSTTASGKGQNPSPLAIPPTSITFAKFVSKVIPAACKVEYQVPTKAGFYFFITGLPNTKPLMQWHNDSNRASWYVRLHEQKVTSHGLSAGWVTVPRIVTFPNMWDKLPVESNKLPSDDMTEDFLYKSHGIRYLICLDGIKESSSMHGSMLFPTLLRRELHDVRSTIEAYSGKNNLMRLKPDEQMEYVGGLSIDKTLADKDKHTFRVTDHKGRQSTYKVVLFE
ncbi:MAG: hypothetical protein M1812_000834 [Candelaria pacifica]|nr:MAG: hypothetical protein M1812_000834 [Candelaria pacifica]